MATLREQILQVLPRLIEEDPAFRQTLLDMLRPYFADRQQTEDRFDRMLEELRRMREESERRWWAAMEELRRMREESERKWKEQQEEQQRKWEEQQRRWEAQERKWEEQQRKWEEQNQKWEEWKARWDAKMEEDRKRWEEQQRKWEEQERKWWENQEEIRKLRLDIRALDRRITTVLGSIGSRWGTRTEAAFRNAIVGILREFVPEVQVERVVERDEAGEVFGHPADIELDLFIHDGLWILGEIKASLDKDDVHLFVRKARFFEARRGRKADRWIIIAPMSTAKARRTARKLGICVYTFPDQAANAFTPPSGTETQEG